jgi:hypothetical protein
LKKQCYGQGLTVVPQVCLHHSAAVYYFVAPEEAELAAAIEGGLQRLRASDACSGGVSGDGNGLRSSD